MCEKRRYNGALRILAVFRGRASQPARGGEGGGFPKPPSHPAAARRSSEEWEVVMFFSPGKTPVSLRQYRVPPLTLEPYVAIYPWSH